MKRILFFLPNLNSGGVERVTLNILRLLDDNKFTKGIALVEKVGELVNLLPENVKMFDLKCKRTRYAFFKFFNCIRTFKPDIIVSRTNRTNILALAISCFFNREIKILAIEPSMPKSQFLNKHIPKYYYFLMRFFYRKAYAIVAQSKEMKDEIVQYLKIKREKIRILHNPMDMNFIDKMVESEECPFDTNEINVVASGNLYRRKGFDILIKAFHKVIQNNNKFKLYILGKRMVDNEYESYLINLIKELGMEDYIELLGFKSNPYIYYKYADLFVLSSRWEGLPNVVLEALYLKTPVVATNCTPSLSTIIRSGENGFIIDVDDIDMMAKRILEYDKLKVQEYDFDKQDVNEFFSL